MLAQSNCEKHDDLPEEPFPISENLELTVEGKEPEPLKPGSICPKCGQGKLDYDGMLNLACPLCGFVDSGCFT